jgi:hypothetical protein
MQPDPNAHRATHSEGAAALLPLLLVEQLQPQLSKEALNGPGHSTRDGFEVPLVRLHPQPC